jgi:phosphoribosylformimino-5-aminoimidazole carboxamide ribotide isomerase
MELIPVIDLKEGRVVHARQGHRSEYRPVQSRLCPGADPLDVVDAFLRLYPFRTLYVADLDAISGAGDHRAQLLALRARFPQLDLWVDSGIGDAKALDRWIDARIGRLVIGSEALDDAGFVEAARARCGAVEPVLSLDFIGDAFKGPTALLDDPARLWPRRVLAMNVRRVGSGAGPDIALLVALASKSTGTPREIYAAGGVRSASDLVQLHALGAAGALAATALHDGSLGRHEIEALAGMAPASGQCRPAP